MNARFYVPSIGRFASADTIVPDPTNPQAHNRYSYVENNPLRYTDPTGHCIEDEYDEYDDYECFKKAQELASEYEDEGLLYSALIILTLEQLNQFHGLLMKALNNKLLPTFAIRHAWVQVHFMMTNPGTLMEVAIPKAGPSGVYQGFADLLNPTTGEIWEVKPASYSADEAYTQLNRYISNYPGGTRGHLIPTTAVGPDPIEPYKDLYYSSTRNGVPLQGLIFYWPAQNGIRRTELDVDIEPNPVDPWWLYVGLFGMLVDNMIKNTPTPTPIPVSPSLVGGGGVSPISPFNLK